MPTEYIAARFDSIIFCQAEANVNIQLCGSPSGALRNIQSNKNVLCITSLHKGMSMQNLKKKIVHRLLSLWKP